jgi:hypothetical protein
MTCIRCGGSLRQGPILSNYKSFVVSLYTCRDCGATVEHKDNAHRPSDPMGPTPGQRKPSPPPESAAARRTPSWLLPHPERAPEPPPAPPAPRRPLAKRLTRPFNIRVTRAGDRRRGRS